MGKCLFEKVHLCEGRCRESVTGGFMHGMLVCRGRVEY